MKILVVGGGGREHAIIKSLKKSPRVTEIFAAPGNGGIAADAICTGIGAKDLDAITAFAKDNAIDFAVVAPDDPLVLGAVDRLEAIGIPCFGPNKAAAILEGSKVFSKDLMKKYHIPTAEYAVFDDMDQALAYLKTAPIPTVVKADGLALGKGVTVAMTREEAEEAVRACMETIFLPTMHAMNAEGRTFKGCLYFGLMLTENGPKVIEYNCRFGDPETQVVLPLLESDLLTIMEATAKGELAKTEVKFSDKSACCLVLASQGYPKKYETGYPITIPADLDAEVYVAGAKLDDGVLKTAGGRVLGVSAIGNTLKEAIEKAYREGAKVKFENAYCRKDIGAKALRAEEEVK